MRLGWLLSACLLACSSDRVIGPDPAPLLALGPLVGRLPFLAPRLADARSSPVISRGDRGGFVVEGRGPGRRRPPARGDAEGQAGGLRVSLGLRAQQAFAVGVSGAGPLSVRRRGASDHAGHVDQGVLFYEEAFPGADALVAAQGEGVEELILAHGPGAEPGYEVDLPPRWRLRAQPGPGLVEVLDASGSARLRVWANHAWDAGGQEIKLALSVEGQRIGLRAAEGARYPVVIDPVFVGTGDLLAARSAHTATTLADGTVLVAGGAGGSAVSAEIYDPRTGRFTATAGAMAVVRSRHTATLLPDGRVLLVGGNNGNEAVDSAEIYDPATGTFALLPATLATVRQDHTATAITDGRILIAGGQDSSSPLDTAELYDPIKHAFKPVAAHMAGARTLHTATAFASGKVLLTGGQQEDDRSAEVFDVLHESFAPTATQMIKERQAHTATLLPDGRILLVGGTAGPAATATQNTMEVYDPTSNGFTLLSARLSVARREHTATRLADNRVVFVGGLANPKMVQATAEWFDPITEQCHPIAATLIAGRDGHTVSALPGGGLLIAGGTEAAGNQAERLETGQFTATTTDPVVRHKYATATAMAGRVLLAGGSLHVAQGEVYDGATGRFSLTLGLMQAARERHTATTLLSGKVLLAGGQTDQEIGILGTAEEYDPATDLFTPTVEAMASNRYAHTATLLDSAQVLITGGQASSSLDLAELYDPISRTFTPTPTPLVHPRAFHTATKIAGGRVLLAGGNGILGVESSAEIYNPVTKGFTLSAGSLSAERSSHTATLLPDGRVLLAGGQDLSDAKATADLYDPATDTFTPSKHLLSTQRSEHTATLLDDGRVLLAGGSAQEQGTAEIYDPATDTFTPTAGLMVVARTGHAAEKLADGRVLLAGGLADPGTGIAAEIYDPTTDQFSPIDLAHPIDGRAATETPDATVLLTGGPVDEPPLVLSAQQWFTSGKGAGARLHHTSTLLPDLSDLLIGGQDAAGSPLASIASFTPEGGSHEAGTLVHARAWHTATRLPDGRVLVAGGEASGLPLASFELVTPGKGSTGQGSLLQPRSHHAAALLPDGKVLLAGGVNQQGMLTIAEVFDPATGQTEGLGEAQIGADPSIGFVGEGALILSGANKSVRFEPATRAFLDLLLEPSSGLATLATGHALACQTVCRFLDESSATGGDAGSFRLLPGDRIKAMGTGAVGLAGTRDSHGWVGWGSVLETGAVRPVIEAPSRVSWLVGEHGSVSGQGWTATGAPAGPAHLGDPLVLAWKPLDSAGPVHVLAVSQWGDGTVDFTLPTTAYTGPGWLYVIAGGVPSEGQLLTLLPAPTGQACGIGAHCASGFCVDGICCDQICQDGCLACSASLKGAGADGVCGPIADGRAPRFGCANPDEQVCGFTGSCDGAGACMLPGITTLCSDQGDRCQGGVCAPPPAVVCDDRTGELVSVSGRESCHEYRCRDGACLTRCASHLDCASGNHCTSTGQCTAALLPDDPGDPGPLCSVHAGAATPGHGGLAAWALVAAAAVAWQRRRQTARLGAAVALALAAPAAHAQGSSGHGSPPVSLPLAASTPLPPAASGAPLPPAASGAPLPPAASGAPLPPAASTAPPGPLDPRKEEARDLLRKGLALYQAGEIPKALDFFLRSRIVYPAKGNVINAANCLRALGRLDEALELYEEAVASYAASFDEDDQRDVPAAMATLRAQVGALFVSASTAGSLVIDGRERGKLPLSSSVRLLPGPHLVRVLKDGYRTFEAPVSIQLGETARLDARLEPLAAAGGLRIEDPSLPGAEVLVDGVLVGQAPWEGTLAPGPHVVLSRQGDEGSAPTLATVLQGQTALLRLKSTRLGPSRRLLVSPATAELRLDDVPLGKGQWVGALPAGPHTIAASEEGYLTATRVLGADQDSRDVVLRLEVDETHPRWPKKPSGTLLAEVRTMFGIGYGLHGGAGQSCTGAACTSHGLLDGPVVAIGASYEFPFRLSLDAAVGALTLSQDLRREVPRQGEVGANSGVSYQLDDRLRLKGYWLAAGLGYRLPLGGRWSLRSRLLAGVLFARSSDTIGGSVTTSGGEARASSDGSGREVASTPFFLLPEVGMVAELGDWRLAGSLTAWVMVSSGPPLPNGALQVFPGCTGKDATAPGCVADSAQLAGERSYQAFAVLLPQLSLARVF